MKTYAPKTLHGAMLRDLINDLPATPAQVAKFLRVSERTVWRWLSDQNAPYAVLAALWHETPVGRYASACDVGNEVRILHGLANANKDALQATEKQLARVLAIADTGATNDPLFTIPLSFHSSLSSDRPRNASQARLGNEVTHKMVK